MIQDFYSDVLDLVKQKGFYTYEYMRDFEKFKEKFPSEEKFCILLTVKKSVNVSMRMSMLLRFGIDLKCKQ